MYVNVKKTSFQEEGLKMYIDSRRNQKYPDLSTSLRENGGFLDKGAD